MTFAEIQKYPPGTIYNKIHKKYEREGYWYTDIDKQIIKAEYPNAIIKPDNTFTYVEDYNIENVVDAWLFDGEEWYCVESTWDGYVIISDNDIKKGNRYGKM